MSDTTQTAESTGKRRRSLNVIGIIMVVIGAIMVIVGGVAWGAVSSQLSAQKMTVPGDALSNAGAPVAGPFTAWSMQETINMHAEKITGGQTYSELGAVVNEAKETYGEDSPEAAEAQATRDTAMNASLLRTSLLTSVLSFGVSLFAMGSGALAILTGAGFVISSRRRA
ncbi:aromatic ring-opening dioxygenase LigA [Actinomycetaceae bacterium WB03_NA08]|uniref:Aromatic ring-opening dioxygenase LigA n=1 Tax=Scrofimicrobium canadense TaxID=2652290 RepID=A0A6N7W753_9ACTO|nr:aromatic ring-opening dioxygenase LigA [Scrofimicrobium canadense]MSS84262.1 aromatic ring-opening dioxygenase LigA [Scrofimicrobium canadense]